MMFVGKYLIFLCFILNNFDLIYSCGCYGSASCTPNGILCDHQSNNTCVCDCCSACNTCEQFFEFNCLADRYMKHYSLSMNQSDIILKVNESILSNYIIDQTTGEIVRYLWDPCLRRLLPNDIYLIDDNEGRYKLIGIARKKLRKTYYEILFKGPVSLLIVVNFAITII